MPFIDEIGVESAVRGKTLGTTTAPGVVKVENTIAPCGVCAKTARFPPGAKDGEGSIVNIATTTVSDIILPEADAHRVISDGG